MPSIGDLYVGVHADLKQFGNELTRGAKKAGEEAGTTAANGFRARFDEQLARIRSTGGGSLGKGLLLGVGAGIGLGALDLAKSALMGLGDTIGDAIDAASDLAESQSKVAVVFDKSADEIEAWSRTASTSMGLSQTAALQAAGTFGNLFDAMGLSNDAAVDMSKGIVQLAADLGSFNNVGTEEVLVALQSGLLGEAEPMRRFGSALSAARVEAHALAQGWVQNKKDLTEAMKVQARYEIILADTVNAQGDFARTADGMANKSKTAAARAQELTTEMGKLIAPIGDLALDVGLSAVDTVVALGGAFNDLWRFMDPGQAKLDDTRAAIRKLADQYGVAADDVIDFTMTLDESARQEEERVKAMEAARREEEYRHGLARQAAEDWRDLNGVTEDAVLTQDQAARSSAYVIEQMRYQRYVLNEAGDAWLTMDEAAHLANGTLDAVNKQLEEGRKAIERYQSVLVGGTTPMSFFDQFREEADETAETFTELPRATGSAVRRIKVDLSDLVGISRNTLRDTRDEIKDRMKDIQDALEHPFRDDKLEKEYETAIKRATRKMNRALEQGNEEAYAEASEFVREYKAKLRELRMQRFRVRVQMFVDDAGVTGPGATLLGGLAGAAWGSRPARRAAGGPVTRGMPYIVGEDRPELFIPDSNGRIAPEVPTARRIDFYVHDPDGGLARAGIGTRQLAAAIASDTDAQRRWEDAF